MHNAKEKVKNKEFINKKMHIDGYNIELKKTKEKIRSYNHHQVRFLKPDKSKG